MGPFEGVGRALRELRVKRGFPSQAALAKKMSVAQTTVGRWEDEEANPQTDSINAYLVAIGADAHDLAFALDLVAGRESARGREDELVLKNQLIAKMAARAILLEEQLEEEKKRKAGAKVARVG